MKKPNIHKGFKTLTVLFAVFLAALWLIPVPAYAQDGTAYTYNLSEDNKWVRTQDAYLTGGILFKDAGFKKPEDIFVKGNKVFIADTGNSQIAVMDISNNKITYIGKGMLDTPTGVFVDDQDRIFVADYGLAKVVLFSPDGKVIKSYGRPDSVVFGKSTTFKPRKVVSDKGGNIYIVSEGSYDGIVQLSNDGEFLGYFGANQTGISPLEAMENLIFTKEQKAKLFHRVPKTFNNIDIDKKGMIYSITLSVYGNAIKKHSVSGSDILIQSQAGKMADEKNFTDITVGQNGEIYAVTETGLIYEYDSYGDLIFSFGGRAISTERNGLFTVASGISVDDNGYLYVLDRERGIVQIFYPTSFANMTHQAVDLYENGQYLQSENVWQEVLTLSGTSKIAHEGMGNAYLQLGQYNKAAEQFKIAQDRTNYSQAYWEIRNDWLQSNTGWIIIILIFFLLINKMLKMLDIRYGIFDTARKIKSRILESRVVRDVMYLKNIIKHPIDSFYYIRKDEKGSVLSATIIYFLALVIFIMDYLFRGFIFNMNDARKISYSYVLTLFLMPVLLWVTGNYMVSSINEGEGRIKDVYCATAYSFAPYILFMPIVIVLTYALTLNEVFIINFSSLIIWVWVGVVLFLGLKEIHDYEIRDVVKNILLTLFFMFIAVVVFSIIYMLWSQGIDFVYSIVKEVAYRAH